METSLLLFLLLAPFAGFLFNVFFEKVSRNVSGTIGTIAVAVSFGIALNFFFQINSTKQPILIDLFHWMTLGNFDVSFSFLLDQLSVLWLLFVTGIGTLIHIYSISYMHDDENLHKFLLTSTCLSSS